MDSILTSIKKLLGIEADITNFDPDITMFINGALLAVNQIGVGPTTGFIITGSTETWDNLLGTREDIEAVKLYVYFKVRLAFDPPTNSFLVDAIKQQITELEWRINVQVDDPPAVVVTPTVVEGGV